MSDLQVEVTKPMGIFNMRDKAPSGVCGNPTKLAQAIIRIFYTVGTSAESRPERARSPQHRVTVSSSFPPSLLPSLFGITLLPGLAFALVLRRFRAPALISSHRILVIISDLASIPDGLMYYVCGETEFFKFFKLQKERKKEERERDSSIYQHYIHENLELKSYHSACYGFCDTLINLDSEVLLWQISDFKSHVFSEVLPRMDLGLANDNQDWLPSARLALARANKLPSNVSVPIHIIDAEGVKIPTGKAYKTMETCK
ncbi:hypothetical protein FB451DRAFT_1185221 [Mycena latifolia]|nr:hypothetical protein FB451DRAFT_1185221 [Mycena latifolia]